MNSNPGRYILMLTNSLQNASKGKGKSGGSRVLTYTVKQLSEDEVSVTLMAIYDKGDISNVSDAYIRSLVQQIETQL